MAFQKNIYQKVLPITALLLFGSMVIAQKTVRYDLYISDTTVNYTGKKVKALAINGQIPAPTLIFTEGDTALIYVHNTLRESSSIHWHGITQPIRRRTKPHHSADKTGCDPPLQIPNRAKRHLLVSQPYQITGATRDVRRFYHP